MDKERAERAGHFRQKRIGFAAISLVGLLFAVGGITTASLGTESMLGRLALDLPDWLSIPFIVLITVEAIFIVYLLVPALAAGRKRQERPKSTLASIVLLLVLGASVWGVPRSNLGLDVGDWLSGGVKTSGSEGQAEALAEAVPPVHSALTSGIMEAFLLALAVIGFGVMVWLYLGTRPRQGRDMPRPLAPSALQTAIEDSLDDLRHLPDARIAIIKCYGRFERFLAGADIRPAPWETAIEFMRTALKVPGLPHDAVRELTSLFELARFSQHALGPEHRERAWTALMTARDALEKEAVHDPAA